MWFLPSSRLSFPVVLGCLVSLSCYGPARDQKIKAAGQAATTETGTGSSQAEAPAADSESIVVSETPPAISRQERFTRHWTRTVTRRNVQSGEITTQTNEFVELASGLNYQVESGQWQETRELFEPTADGGF